MKFYLVKSNKDKISKKRILNNKSICFGNLSDARKFKESFEKLYLDTKFTVQEIDIDEDFVKKSICGILSKNLPYCIPYKFVKTVCGPKSVRV